MEIDAARLPDDAQLADVVRDAHARLVWLDPLGAALRGEAEPKLPPGEPDFDAELRSELAAISGALDGAPVASADDQADREALKVGLARAVPPAGPRLPAGLVTLEVTLLAALRGLDMTPERGAESLATILEAAPEFLALARLDTAGGPAAAGRIAVDAGRRIPQILDLVAAAAWALPLPGGLRERIEAGLGLALAASAEDTGWVLRVYLPSAGPPAPDVDSIPGLGMDTGELEGWAEALLAAQVGAPEAPAGRESSAPTGDVDVAAACARAEQAWDPWCAGPPGVPFDIAAAPAWLGPLLPPLSLADPGSLSSRPIRLLVGDLQGLEPGAIDAAVAAIHAADYLPAAWSRNARLARVLMPAPDAGEGWRALVLQEGPRLAGFDSRLARRELSWRAILALTALGLARGQMDAEAAVALVVAETGMDAERAALQVDHVTVRPRAALTFIAGAAAMERAVEPLGGGPEARARLLAAGPLPASAHGLVEPERRYTR